MKFVVQLHLIAIVWAYTDVDDAYKFGTFLKNSDDLKKMEKCFLNKGPCDEALLHYKNHISESMEHACSLCTEEQKHHYKTFLSSFRKFYPEGFKDFLKLYDKNNHYKVLEKELDSY